MRSGFTSESSGSAVLSSLVLFIESLFTGVSLEMLSGESLCRGDALEVLEYSRDRGLPEVDFSVIVGSVDGASLLDEPDDLNSSLGVEDVGSSDEVSWFRYLEA